LKADQIIILGGFAVMFIQMLGFGIFLRRHNLSLAGATPIHKALFKSAKAAMFITWTALFVQATGIVDLTMFNRANAATVLAVVFFVPGVVLQLWAYFELGKNLKFGIPHGAEEEAAATFKTSGLYRFSRHPMYVGFFLMLLAACLYVLQPVVWVLSSYAGWVHHQITLKEEQFLEKRFGAEWQTYISKVRRYL
jgi:protein-S-isoprenylcysteine O-methyltransferase Ste14